MPIGDIYKLSVVAVGPNNQELVNTFHYRQEGVLIFDEVGPDLVAAWDAEAQPDYLFCFSSSVELASLEVRSVTGDPYVFESFYPTPRPSGTQSGDVLPPTTAAVISWRTGLPGRSKRGRTYVFPTVESVNSAGMLDAGYKTNIEAFADAAMVLEGSITYAEYQLVVWSPTLASGQAVTTKRVDDRFGTQRRRRPGVGS